MKEIKCSVIGLGKLGSPLAAILGKHFPTIGVDLNKEYVEKINQKIAPVQEPGLQELLQQSTLTATTSITETIKQSNITFIIVPTPSQADGKFTNQYVLDAIAEIGAAIAQKSTYHLVCITSTVMPGSTRNEIANALQTASGRLLGENLGLTYNPEFIALGDVINGIENPDMVLIGEPSAKSKEGDILENLYNIVCKDCHKIVRTSFENAEIAKLSLNTFLTMKIAYANTLGQICDVLPNSDAKEVTRIISQDTRISPKFLTPGMPFGGPCLPRDTVAFNALARSVGVQAEIAVATKKMNEQHLGWLVEKIRSLATDGNKIAVLGLSYKAGTDVIEASSGVDICIKLAELGFIVDAFDPLIKSIPSPRFASGEIKIQSDILSCISSAALIVISTPCKEFKSIKDLSEKNSKFPTTIIDCWGIFNQDDQLRTRIVHIGKHMDDKLAVKKLRLTAQ